jgi:hypothetical protein
MENTTTPTQYVVPTWAQEFDLADAPVYDAGIHGDILPLEDSNEQQDWLGSNANVVGQLACQTKLVVTVND